MNKKSIKRMVFILLSSFLISGCQINDLPKQEISKTQDSDYEELVTLVEDRVAKDDHETQDSIDEKETSLESTDSVTANTKTQEIESVLSESVAFQIEEDLNETVYAVSTVNVRELPDKTSTKIGSLKSGEHVIRTGLCDNGWSRVIYLEGIAYIHSSYLTTVEPVASTVINKETTQQATASDESTQTVTGSVTEESATVAETKPKTAVSSDFDVAYMNARFLTLVNELRISQGLGTLTLDATLNSGAAIRASELPTSFSHTRPDGSNFNSCVSGITSLSENLSKCEVTPCNKEYDQYINDMWQGLYNSPKHYAAMIDSRRTIVGIQTYAVAFADGGAGFYTVFWFSQ